MYLTINSFLLLAFYSSSSASSSSSSSSSDLNLDQSIWWYNLPLLLLSQIESVTEPYTTSITTHPTTMYVKYNMFDFFQTLLYNVDDTACSTPRLLLNEVENLLAYLLCRQSK